METPKQIRTRILKELALEWQKPITMTKQQIEHRLFILSIKKKINDFVGRLI